MRPTTAGFSLVEVLIATGIVMGCMASLAPLVVFSDAANRVAGGRSIALLAAQEKIETLRAAPGDANASPPGALTADTTGYVDYLDAGGAPLSDSGGVDPPGAPGAAMYVRRWAIETPGAVSGRAAILRVLVVPSTHSRERGRHAVALTSVALR